MRNTKDITKREGRGTKGNGKITNLGYRKGIIIAHEYQIITIIRLGLLKGGELACHIVSGAHIKIPSGVIGLNHVSTNLEEVGLRFLIDSKWAMGHIHEESENHSKGCAKRMGRQHV